MIRTTMANEIGGGHPGHREHGNQAGKVGSRNVIRTTVKKTTGGQDKFVGKMGKCGYMRGGPGTEAVDRKED